MKAKLSATEFTFGGRMPQLRDPTRALHVPPRDGHMAGRLSLALGLQSLEDPSGPER
jgi:hypothetical protein